MNGEAEEKRREWCSRMENRENGRVSSYHYNGINQLIREEIQRIKDGNHVPQISGNPAGK